MIAVRLLLVLGALTAAQGADRATLGVFGVWAAFRDSAPPHCFAIAQPAEARLAGTGAFASIASWPGQRLHNQLNLHLTRPRHPKARVTLSVGERRFELVAGERDAWAPDARTDAAVVAAIRSGRSMSVETIAANGAPFADVYSLEGAASAIDAAALGCVRR